MSMWRRILELEEKITSQRVGLAREYMASQGVDTSELSAEDLLSIYSCMVVKVKKGMER
jgi:hypothetical protein